MTHDPLDTFLDDALLGRISRREVFRRGAALGLAPALLGGIAAARPGIARAQEAGSLTLASYSSDPEPRKQMEETVADFTAATGVQVELNTVNHEDFKQAIRTYLASDTPPDALTWFAGNRMRFFVDKGLVMPLDDLFAAEGWEEDFPEGIKAVSKGADGKYYFVPTSYYWWAVYYRPSLFEKAGIEGTPETFDDMLAAVEKLKAAGITPITIGTKAPWTAAAWFDYLNMRTNGPEFHISLMDGKEKYNSDEVKATFANWRKLLDAGAFIAQPEALEWQDAVTPLYNGEAAMYLMGGFIRDSFPDDAEADLDFFRFPKINDVPIGEDAPTDGYFLAAKAANPDPAKAFMAYVGGKDSQEKAAKELGRIAVNKQVPLDVYDPATAKGVELLQGADYIAQFYDRDTLPEMAEKGMAAFVEFWNDPDSIDAILDNLEAERERIFAAAASEG
ncbi:MAG: ABC transporter substrate-binding protein [Chloroflexota bacterium]